MEMFFCDCGSEALSLDYWDEEARSVMISVWRASSKRPRWKMRLSLMWHILRHGTPYGDDVILTSEDAIRMGSLLHKLGGQHAENAG